MGAFKNYSIGFVVVIFAFTMITNFSGSMFQTYNTNVSSDTLNKIKGEAEGAQQNIGNVRNRTSGINPEDSTFLSPQAFGVIGDTLGSAGNLFGIFSTAEKELGLPGQITFLFVGVITLRLIWAAVSALFGWEL